MAGPDDLPDLRPPTVEQRREAGNAAETMRRAANMLDRLALAVNDAAAECGLAGCELSEAWAHLANYRPGLYRQVSNTLGPMVVLRLAELLRSTAEDAEQIGSDHRALAVARAILGRGEALS